MTNSELLRYNLSQIKEIQKYRISESMKAGSDIDANKAAAEWISRYSEGFYRSYVAARDTRKTSTI